VRVSVCVSSTRHSRREGVGREEIIKEGGGGWNSDDRGKMGRRWMKTEESKGR
jgi:hypothetical protein